MKEALWVALGGGAGSLLRWYISLWLPKSENGFPMATLFVNIAGSLLIGVGAGLLLKNSLSESGRLLLLTGFCGGFTTFSAFSVENLQLLQQQQYLLCAVYLLASIVLGGLAVFIGFNLSH